MSTLKERIAELSAGMPRGWQAKLARKCGIAAVSVNGWVTGKSKNIDGNYLTTVADFFQVNPHWLSKGEGEKSPLHHEPTSSVQYVNVTPDAEYKPTEEALRVAKLFDMIPEDDLIRRSLAYSAATTAIIGVIQGHTK